MPKQRNEPLAIPAATIVGAVVMAGQRGDVGQFVVGFVGHGQQRGTADDQVAFDVEFGEQLQQAHAVDEAGRAADADHHPLAVHACRLLIRWRARSSTS